MARTYSAKVQRARRNSRKCISDNSLPIRHCILSARELEVEIQPIYEKPFRMFILFKTFTVLEKIFLNKAE